MMEFLDTLIDALLRKHGPAQYASVQHRQNCRNTFQCLRIFGKFQHVGIRNHKMARDVNPKSFGNHFELNANPIGSIKISLI